MRLASDPTAVQQSASKAPVRVADKLFFTCLDGIRGVAALLIVLRHTEQLVSPILFQESYLAVDVFFVLSGVVISQAYEVRLLSNLSFTRFAQIRIVRIFPLYILGTVISALCAITGLLPFGTRGDLPLYIILGLFLIPNPGIGTINVFPLNNPAWSLFLELVVNMFYAKFLHILSRKFVFVIMSVSALGIMLMLYKAQSHSLNVGFWAKSFPFGLLRVFYSFFAGVVLFKHFQTHRRQSTGLGATVMSWAIIASVAAVLVAAPRHDIQPYYDFAAVIFVFPALVYAALKFQPQGLSAQICKFLGAISYAVYTLHAPLAGFIEAFSLSAAHINLAHWAPWAGLVFVAVLIPICAVADRVYDWPVRRCLLSLKLG